MAVSIIKFKDLKRCSLKEIRMQFKAFNIMYACFLVFVKVDTIEQFKINLEYNKTIYEIQIRLLSMYIKYF